MEFLGLHKLLGAFGLVLIFQQNTLKWNAFSSSTTPEWPYYCCVKWYFLFVNGLYFWGIGARICFPMKRIHSCHFLLLLLEFILYISHEGKFSKLVSNHFLPLEVVCERVLNIPGRGSLIQKVGTLLRWHHETPSLQLVQCWKFTLKCLTGTCHEL